MYMIMCFRRKVIGIGAWTYFCDVINLSISKRKVGSFSVPGDPYTHTGEDFDFSPNYLASNLQVQYNFSTDFNYNIR